MRCAGQVFVVLCLMLVGVAHADENADLQFEKIGELNEAYVVAFNAKEVSKIGALFTEDGEFTVLTGDLLSGRELVSAGHLSFFQNNPEAEISGQQLTRRFIRPDVVVATGKWSVKDGPTEFSSAGIWSTVVVKKDGKWRYEAMRLMVPETPESK